MISETKVSWQKPKQRSSLRNLVLSVTMLYPLLVCNLLYPGTFLILATFMYKPQLTQSVVGMYSSSWSADFIPRNIFDFRNKVSWQKPKQRSSLRNLVFSRFFFSSQKRIYYSETFLYCTFNIIINAKSAYSYTTIIHSSYYFFVNF